MEKTRFVWFRHDQDQSIAGVEIAMFLRALQVQITVLLPPDIENRRKNPRPLRRNPGFERQAVRLFMA